MRLLPSIVIALSVAATSHAQPVGREPGEAQAKGTSSRAMITEFTHPAVESRGVWLPSNAMFDSREKLMATLDRMKAAGFDRVMIDTQFRGYVLYPTSAILPQYPPCKGEDYLKLLIDACHQRGMKADAYMEYGFYAYFTADKNDTSMGKILDADPSLLSVDRNGEGKIVRSFGTFYSLDPSQPGAVKAIADLNAEVATKYDVDAVSLDRCRFADFDHLSLAGRARFERETGVTWSPAAYDAKSDDGKKLSDWKRQQNLIAVRAICAAIRKAKPGLPITGYVVPPDEKDNKSQSYDLWMRENLLDLISVSMYAADITADAKKAIALMDGKTDHLVAALDTDRKTKMTAQVLTNVEVSRQMGMRGQFVWYTGTVSDELASALKAGPYARPAMDPTEKK